MLIIKKHCKYIDLNTDRVCYMRKYYPETMQALMMYVDREEDGYEIEYKKVNMNGNFKPNQDRGYDKRLIILDDEIPTI